MRPPTSRSKCQHVSIHHQILEAAEEVEEGAAKEYIAQIKAAV